MPHGENAKDSGGLADPRGQGGDSEASSPAWPPPFMLQAMTNAATMQFPGTPPVLPGTAGVFVSTCGHGMHIDCWQRFFASNFARRRRAEEPRLAWEFRCPLCEVLCNCAMPVLRPCGDGVSTSDMESYKGPDEDSALVASLELDKGSGAYFVDQIPPRPSRTSIVQSHMERLGEPPSSEDVAAPALAARLPALPQPQTRLVQRVTELATGRIHGLAAANPVQSEIGAVNAADALAFTIASTVGTLEWETSALEADQTIRTLPHLVEFVSATAELREDGIASVSAHLIHGEYRSTRANAARHLPAARVLAYTNAHVGQPARFLVPGFAEDAMPWTAMVTMCSPFFLFVRAFVVLAGDGRRSIAFALARLCACLAVARGIKQALAGIQPRPSESDAAAAGFDLDSAGAFAELLAGAADARHLEDSAAQGKQVLERAHALASQSLERFLKPAVVLLRAAVDGLARTPLPRAGPDMLAMLGVSSAGALLRDVASSATVSTRRDLAPGCPPDISLARSPFPPSCRLRLSLCRLSPAS